MALTGTPSALDDLASPEIDPRVTQLLAALSVDCELHVRLVKTGHPLGPVTPGGRENDHWFYRAVDIDMVDRILVVDEPDGEAMLALGRTLMTLAEPLRPRNILGPDAWHAALGGGGVTGFRDEPAVNARHHDHVHLGFGAL